MAENGSFDISIFGTWPRSPRYTGGVGPANNGPGFHSIEPKARRGAADDDLRLLLNDLTTEMRAQFAFFKRLRVAAVKKGRGGGESEPADELQRRLAANRQEAEERHLNLRDYDNAKAHFLDLIEKRAEELAEKRIAERKTESRAGK